MTGAYLRPRFGSVLAGSGMRAKARVSRFGTIPSAASFTNGFAVGAGLVLAPQMGWC